MNNVTLTFSGKAYHLTGPSSWEELNPEQYLIAVSMGHAELPAQKQTLGLLAVREFLDIPRKVFKALDAEQLTQLLETIAFVYETPGPVSWKIPQIKELYGPADKLANITFGEFIFAEKYFQAQQADYLIATLFRPCHDGPPSGDLREPFSVHTIEGRLPVAASQRESVKQGALYNYRCCRLAMAKLFPHVFPAQEEDAEKEKTSAAASWLDIAIDLARKEPVMGDFEKLQQQNVYLVLRLLDKVMDEHEQQQAELAKARRKRS